MKIASKFLLGINSIVVLVLAMSTIAQYFFLSSHIDDLIGEKLRSSVDLITKDMLFFINNGEMKHFGDFIRYQCRGRKNHPIQRIDFYDARFEPVASSSTDPYQIKPETIEIIRSRPLDRHFEYHDDHTEIYQPIIVEKSCVTCHSGFRLGDIGAVIHTNISIVGYQTLLMKNIWFIFGINILIFLFFTIFVLFHIKQLVIMPLLNLNKAIQHIHDEGVLVPIIQHRDDEIGELANSFNMLVDNLNKTTVSKALLNASLKEKELLLHEVHHRVKNNLAVISSFLDLQAKDAADPKFSEHIAICRGRILSIALIHERLYLSSNFADIEMKPYVEVLIGRIVSTYNIVNQHIVISSDIDDVHLDINRAIPCGMLINELITNSMKHGFKDRREGTIHVSLKRTNASLDLNVVDNGQGVVLEATETGSEKKQLSMIIAEALTKQLDGSWDISSNTEGGTKIRVRFPA